MMESDAISLIHENYDFSGHFESDFVELCKRAQLVPFSISKIAYPLPPLPGVRLSTSTTNAGVALVAGQVPLESLNAVPLEGGSLPAGMAQVGQNATVGEDKGSSHISPGQPMAPTQSGLVAGMSLPSQYTSQAQMGPPAVTSAPSTATTTGLSMTPLAQKHHVYESKYKYSPSVLLEAVDEEDEDMSKASVRGWKMSLPLFDILVSCIGASIHLRHLTLWNNGLSAQQFHLLTNALNNSTIRHLQYDQNPLGPDNEQLYANLIGEDSMLKTLTLRGNHISDKGGSAIALALKTNRSLRALNLRLNQIGREGAEHFAETLKLNHFLCSLSLAANKVDDAGAIAIAKSLTKCPIMSEEIASRKRFLAEMDKRRDIDEDSVIKRGKRIPTAHRLNSPGKKPTGAQEENLNFPKKDSTAGQQENAPKTVSKKPGQRRGGKEDKGNPSGSMAAGGAGAGSGANIGGAGNSLTGASGGAGAGGAGGSGVAPSMSSTKKGGGVTSSAANTSANASNSDEKQGQTTGGNPKRPGQPPAPVQEDTKAAKSKDGGSKKGGAQTATRSSRKGKEEVKEEVEEVEPQHPMEAMMEQNGQWFTLGNRTLNNLNLSHNLLTEATVLAFLESLSEQETLSETVTDGSIGLFRISLQSLLAMMNARNPYLEDLTHSNEGEEKENPAEAAEGETDGNNTSGQNVQVLAANAPAEEFEGNDN